MDTPKEHKQVRYRTEYVQQRKGPSRQAVVMATAALVAVLAVLLILVLSSR